MSQGYHQPNINLGPDLGPGQIQFSAPTVQALQLLTSNVNGVQAGSLAVVSATGNVFRALTATPVGSTWQPATGLWDLRDFAGDAAAMAAAILSGLNVPLTVNGNITQEPGNTSQFGNTTIGNGVASASWKLNAIGTSVAVGKWQIAGVDAWDVRRNATDFHWDVLRRDGVGAFLSIPIRARFDDGSVELGGIDGVVNDRMAVSRRSVRVTTTDNTPVDVPCMAPGGDQRTSGCEVLVRAARDAGDNFFMQKLRIVNKQTGGTVGAISSGNLYGPTGVGTGATLTAAFALSGGARVLRLTGNVGENWRWGLTFEEMASGW